MSNQPQQTIAVLNDWWWPDLVGGAEMSARAVAYSLAESATVTVLVPSVRSTRYSDGPLQVVTVPRVFARATHPGSVVRRVLEMVATWGMPWTGRELSRELEQLDPDVVIVHNASPRIGPWVLRALRKRGRVVRVVHDLSDTCWLRSRQRSGQNCLTPCHSCVPKAAIWRWATPSSTRSVCVSDFVRSDLIARRLATAEMSDVGYPDVPQQRPGGDRPRDLRFKDSIVLGYIGRLSPVKGLEHAIDVAGAYAHRTGRSVSLTLAGKGSDEYVESLVSRAAATGVELSLRGWQNIDDFCGSVDVVLIPSTWMEPFGRVALEAGLRGVPMLVSPIGGLPEAAHVSGGVHRFADFADTAAAAAGLVDLIEDSGRPAGAPAPPRPSLTAAAHRAVTAVLQAPGTSATSAPSAKDRRPT